MNEHIVASSSASVPTITDDPAADEKKKTDNPVLKVRTRKKSDGISKDDSAADSVSASKPETRDDSADQFLHAKQRSSVQLPDSGEDFEDPVYHESIPEGYVPSADDNLSFSSETQSTLEPPQDAGPEASTSAAPVDGNTGPLEENGRQEMVDLKKMQMAMMEKQMEMMRKQMEMMEKQMEMMDHIQQLQETRHNSRTSSHAMPMTEGPMYPASNASRGRGGRGRGDYRDKPSVQPPSPASLQKEDTGTSTSTSAMADDENASGEHPNDPGDAVQAGPVSGASGVSKKEKNGPAKVVEWMFMMWTLLCMKCKTLLTLIKVYKNMILASGFIFYLCSWISFDISKGVKGLVPLSFVLWFWYLLPNDLENEYLQGFMKEFNNFWLMEYFYERLFYDIIPYIKDQEYVADATANPLLYHALVYSLLLVILLILKKSNHITCTTNVCFTIVLIFWVS